MNPERWQRIRDLHGRASELPAAERAAFLAQECGEDHELRQEVEGLLAAHRQDSFLDEPALRRHGSGPKLGMWLGEFELLSVLGQGAMGIVYLAHQQSLQRNVALKVLTPGLMLTTAQIDRFHREARAVASLRHEHVVRVHCEGKTGETHWFAMEYVRGHDLHQELQRQRGIVADPPLFPRRGEAGHVRAMAILVAEIAEALQHAHEHGIVHRDVKPHNIVIDAATKHCLLTDFGLARDEAQGSLTLPGVIAGTPHYMSPEQARAGATRVDHRTDVFSLGVVLYELLTWNRPYDGESAEEIRSSLLRTEARSVRRSCPWVPRDLETICHTAMAKSLRERYATAGTMAADLRRFLAHEAIEAKPPGWIALTRAALRRNRRSLAIAGLLLMGLVIGATSANALLSTSRYGYVSLRFVGRDDGEQASVSYQIVNAITGECGPDVPLGQGPRHRAAVPQGLTRIRVQVAGEHLHEFTRLVAADDIDIVVQQAPGQTSRMIRVEGGVLRIPTAEAPKLAIANIAVRVEAFMLDECEVSNADYRRFLDATQHTPPRHWARIAKEQDALPVVNVAFEDAVAYAEWSGKRLPTFAEWTLAARGEQLRPFPWSDDRTAAPRGNTTRSLRPFAHDQEYVDWYLANALPVESGDDARTPTGLRHMFGNVAEWTESPFAEIEKGKIILHSDQRLILGGACDCSTRGTTLATYEFQGTGSGFANSRYGFRCARSLP